LCIALNLFLPSTATKDHVYNEEHSLVNLIILALRLRNADALDDGLLIHVIEVLAGNLCDLEGEQSTYTKK
jgi:hypothetical protein